MGLELVIGGQGQGERDRGEAADVAPGGTGGDATDVLADAGRQIAGVRERLQALADSAAELGSRLCAGSALGGGADGGSGGDDPQRRPPEPATE